VNEHPFIAGDWGTTRLRLSLCKGERILDTRSGPGISALTAPPAETVTALTAEWVATHGALPVVLCGMAGSRNGWKETPYVPCPADSASLRRALVRFEAEDLRVSIVPGVSCRNRLGAPDVMRGEETQIVGALALRPDLGIGDKLLCLPGTHTKWVWVEDGAMRHFLTAMTGELFALLRDHSMLARAGTGGSGAGDGFERGLAIDAALGPASLTHALFAARSRQLIDGASKDWALAFISGLLVGSDVRGAIELFGSPREVILIGDPALTDLYVRALRPGRVDTVPLDGGACSLAGLRALAATH